MTVTIAAQDLRRVLRATRPAARPAAPADEYAPELSCIHLEACGGMLAATATDRVVAVRGRCTAKGDLPPVLMPRTMARGVILALDPKRTPPSTPITLDVDGGLLSVGTNPRLTTHPDCEASDWPKLGKLFARASDETGDGHGSRWVQLSSRALGIVAEVLGAASDGDASTKWTVGPQADPGGLPSPILIEYGGWLSLLVMPQRLERDEDPRGHIPFDLPERAS